MTVDSIQEIIDRVLPVAGDVVGERTRLGPDRRSPGNSGESRRPEAPALGPFQRGASGSRLTKTKLAKVRTRTGFRQNSSLSKAGGLLPRAVRRPPSA